MRRALRRRCCGEVLDRDVHRSEKSWAALADAVCQSVVNWDAESEPVFSHLLGFVHEEAAILQMHI